MKLIIKKQSERLNFIFLEVIFRAFRFFRGSMFFYSGFIILLLIFSACSKKSTLTISGNIPQIKNINKTGNLHEILQAEFPTINSEFEQILLIANDELAVEISFIALKEIQLIKDKHGFSSKTKILPEVCNIRGLKEIVIYRQTQENSVFLLEKNNTQAMISPYLARFSEYKILGESSKNDFESRKMNFETDFSFESEADSLLIVFEDGSENWLYNLDFVERHSTLLYKQIILDNNRIKFNEKNISAIWRNPPKKSMKELHKYIIEASQKEPLLLILLDSFGWKYSQNLEALGLKFFDDFSFYPLIASFPPRTKFNLFSVGTGKNLQTSIDKKIFTEIANNTQNALIIEGDQILYESPVKQISVLDDNNDNFIDEEIFNEAMKHISEPLDFLFVHFHSLDDVGHRTTAYSDERLEQLGKDEKYITDLSENWKGKVLLFSDHGMHTENGKGTHYNGCAEDMLAIWGILK